MYDCIIVGMGPAGMSAGIYAKRSGLKTLILEKKAPGGLINITNLVDNYLGYDNITGPELAMKMYEHVKNNEVEYKIEEVTKIKKEGETFKIETNKNNYESLTVILAGGRQPRKLELEDKLKDLKISRCAICDAPLYKEKEVLVIGAGNSAFEEGIYLSEFANKLTILARSEVKADEEMVQDAKNRKNIEIIEGEEVKSITKEDEKYIVETENQTIKVDGIFSYIGYTPMTEYLSNLNILESTGYIEAKETETEVSGLYACGDIIKKELYQIITATSEGAIAATKAKKYLTEKEK
ncbi:MAG: FAD-dependent oxidoreductase [Bacilli bacterium]|nr:FAD-dependent oxidoreductase [Bacilli bacterium]